MTFSKLLFTAGVLGLAVFVQPSLAATPKDTLVIAKQIDDIITLDPGEVYELSGGEIIANIYDRLLRYEAEDMTKLVGGVAESWTVSADGKTFTFKIRGGPEVRLRRAGDRRGRGLLAAARRHPRQDPGLPVHPARLDQGQRQGSGQRARRVDRRAHHHRELRPVLRAEP